MEDEEFQLLLESVRQMVEFHYGQRDDLNAGIRPMPPEPMEPVVIRALRERIGVSQAVFAMALNVSVTTVQAWEAGARWPDGGNLKLLRVAEAHPQAVFGSLYQPAEQPGARSDTVPPKPRAARKPRPPARAA